MIEQQVADRFRDAVAGEPPLGFDPDAVIDREIKRTRRRRVILAAAAAATMVEAVALLALSGIPGGDGQVQVAKGPTLPGPPPEVTVSLSTFETMLTLDDPLDLRLPNAQLRISDMVIRNPDGDHGTAQLKRADQVMFEIKLENFVEYDVHYNEPIVADPGVPITLAVNCTASVRDCKGVSLAVSGVTLVQEN